MIMTTWWIWLLPAVLLCDVVIQSLIRRHRARYQQPVLTDVQMDEIHASIEVYDFANGHEVNRRPAYPLARMRHGIRAMREALHDRMFKNLADGFAGLRPALDNLADSTRKAGQVFSDKLGRGPW